MRSFSHRKKGIILKRQNDTDLNIVSDQTGDIANDAPAIVQKAIDEDKWIVIEK